MSGFQIPYILFSNTVYTYAPCTLVLWHATLLTLKGSLFPAAFHNPPPLHALQLAYQPLHPICNFFDNHWLQPTPKRLWLRIAQKNTARIRRIYGITPYIAIYTPYKYVYTEFGYGGGRLENTTYIPYRIIHIIIRKRFWPTLCISSDFPAKNNACTPYVYMVLANPSYMYSVSCCLSFLQEVFLTAAEYFGTLVFSYPFSSKKGRNIGKTISRLFTKLYFWILMFAGWLL